MEPAGLVIAVELCSGRLGGRAGLYRPAFPPCQVFTQLWICCHRLMMILPTPLSENKFFTPHLVDSIHRVELCQKLPRCSRSRAGLRCPDLKAPCWPSPSPHPPVLLAELGCSICTANLIKKPTSVCIRIHVEWKIQNATCRRTTEAWP